MQVSAPLPGARTRRPTRSSSLGRAPTVPRLAFLRGLIFQARRPDQGLRDFDQIRSVRRHEQNVRTIQSTELADPLLVSKNWFGKRKPRQAAGESDEILFPLE